MPGPCFERQGAPVGAVAHLLDAGHGGGGEVPEEVVGTQRLAEGQAQRECAGACVGCAPRVAGLGVRAPTQLAGRRGKDGADGVVELPDAGKPGGERYLNHGQGGRLDEHARSLGALRAGDRDRPRSQLGYQQPLQLAHAVAELGGQAGHPRAVDDAVGDHAHGARDHVGAPVPLGRAGGGVGPAALAGAKAGLLRCGGGRVEAHILALGRHRETTGAAVDAGAGDGGEEPAVKARVL